MASILIPLAQGCEELEAVTTIDLLRRAGLDVTTAGLNNEVVKASKGVSLVPDTDLNTALQQDYDMIVLPGGLPGADHLDNDSRLRERIIKMADTGKYVAAICAAPKVLANAGVLKGKKVTCYPGVLDALDIKSEGSAVVEDGNIITSRGPGTAMDFALTLIEKLAGKEKRDEVEKGLVR